MVSDWRSRIERAISEHGLTMKAVSLKAGKGETFVRDMLKRDRTPSADNLAAIENAIEAMSQPSPSRSSNLVQIPDLAIFGGMGTGGELDVYTDANNGDVLDPEQIRGYWSLPDYMTRGLGALKNIYAWEVRGDSMEPTLPGGSVVFVDTSQSSPPPDDIYAINYGDGLMVKRLKLVPRSDRVSVISDNERYGADDLLRTDVHIWGRVVGWFQWRG